MNKIAITISDDRWAKLQEAANRLGISPEELVLMSVEELLNRQETEFQNAMEYVLKKNAELYRRLA
ncbi:MULTISPECIES: DNA-binding protein [Aerosakkonema]|uniref:DNA-binding protein n=1 Tax=Aerosakkonema TaxID=1246629 RepID=UPI0035B8E6EF